MFAKIKVFIYLFLLLFAPFSISQTLPPYPICGFDGISTGVIPSNGNIKALIVFVKFRDDVSPSPDWDPVQYVNSRPSWTEQMIMPTPTSQPYHPSIFRLLRPIEFRQVQNLW
jgi:hypothetical protein